MHFIGEGGLAMERRKRRTPTRVCLAVGIWARLQFSASPSRSLLPRPHRISKRRYPMGTKLYVGGLPYSSTEQQLQELFSQHGSVTSAKIITDKYTGQSRGFGFVEMATAEEAQKAITALNGTQMNGRTITVNEARPQEKRPGGGGGGGADRGAGRRW